MRLYDSVSGDVLSYERDHDYIHGKINNWYRACWLWSRPILIVSWPSTLLWSCPSNHRLQKINVPCLFSTWNLSLPLPCAWSRKHSNICPTLIVIITHRHSSKLLTRFLLLCPHLSIGISHLSYRNLRFTESNQWNTVWHWVLRCHTCN
jgi:hypothetical protein